MGYNSIREQNNACCNEQQRYCERSNEREKCVTESISMPVTMCYVPWQEWNEVYNFENALKHGTIFPELNKPFLGRCGRC